jgi:hypothetical protein
VRAQPDRLRKLERGLAPSDWDINAAGDDTIQGFATSISVNKGETVRFKIDTLASSFNVDIYRLGYYAGQGARQIASLTGVHASTSRTASPPVRPVSSTAATELRRRSGTSPRPPSLVCTSRS